MLPEISDVKGVHPGAILKRELKRRKLKAKDLAISVNEYPQTISAIMQGKRGITPGLSIKLGEELEVQSDYFMLLQASYEVSEASKKMRLNLPKPNVRRVLFWDTDFDKIDWEKQRKAVIKRVFERGNQTEIETISDFYGKEIVKEELKIIQNDFLPVFEKNKKEFLMKS